jgi:hypothetical protein
VNLNEYTHAVFPLIEAALNLGEDDRTELACHVRYLYPQALRGYGDVGTKYVSQAAQAIYKTLGHPGKITQYSYRQQRRFDALGRKDGAFHYEHVFTIWMFDQALRRLPQEAINEESVNRIVADNYAVAWITKDEDHRLRPRYRFNRGCSLADALRAYREVGIQLLTEDGELVSATAHG